MPEGLDLTADFQRAHDRLVAMAQFDLDVAGAMPSPDVFAAIRAPGMVYQDVIASVFAGYGSRPVLGERSYEVRTDPATGESARHFKSVFDLTTFAELRAQVESIAGAWQSETLRVAPGEYVFYISFAGAQMTAIDLAAVYAQAISVPVQANLPEADMLAILRDVGPVTMVASIEYLDVAVSYCLRQQTIRTIVVIDADQRVDAERRAIESARENLLVAGGKVCLLTYPELVAAGRDRIWTPLPRQARGTDAITLIIHTSGSTGTPKGALVHEAQCLQFWKDMQRQSPYITVAYAPQNHFVGRCMVWTALAQGGTAYFTLKSDMSALLEDIRIVRPTFLWILPRFAEVIHQHYLSEVQRLVAQRVSEKDADARVRQEMRKAYLGDRLVAGTVGSAPTSPEVRSFIRECFDIAFAEGYGSTEQGSGGTTWGNQIMRPYVIDYKLRDVPELGYYTTDKPYARGELLVKTRLQFQGYFKRPEATASIIDEDGFLMTGDIMEEREQGMLFWLDRRNNVIKLSQAEYVAIGPLETIFLAGDALLSQIFIYGNSTRSYLLAVVVPDIHVANSRLGREASDVDLRRMVLEALQGVARVNGLKSFEVPRDVLIERESFSLENGLLSSVRKPLRPRLRERYASRLEEIYAAMDAQQQSELYRLRVGGFGLSTLESVAGALKASLGLSAIDPNGSQTFRDLGGDSLGAVSFSLLLEEMFKVAVPVATILGPVGSASTIAAFVDGVREGNAAQASFASVHGADPRVARAADLKLDAFLERSLLEAAPRLASPRERTRTVLITGATGYLGRFLCLSWLEALAQEGGKLICLVRATDEVAARKRLLDGFGSSDAGLTGRFRAIAEGHLELVAGDLTSPRLGLCAADFDRLAVEVDHIVHPGALVNHRLSYRNLFEPNVIGTAELIRLALTTRLKRFDYVSTIGVPYFGAMPRTQCEVIDVRAGAPEMPINDDYASGYAVSKWAGEVLLSEAHDAFRMPVKIFRPNMILGHSRYLGQINVPDMFTRLIFSIVATGLAPESFYVGDRRRAHYDGQPVDFLADAMQRVGQQSLNGLQTFNTVNFHFDDGISLDDIVDWIESAGYSVQRIPVHVEWVRRFEEKLRQLSDQQKQLSALAILGHYSQPHPAVEVPFAYQNYAAALESASPPLKLPHLTEVFVHKFLRDMQVLGMIDAPVGV